MKSRIIAISLLILLTACDVLPKKVEVGPDQLTEQDVTSLGDVWFLSKNDGATSVLRGPDGQEIVPADIFEVSDDGQYIAILSNGVLEMSRTVSPTDAITVASKVESVRWRPGSHDLLFLVRDESEPRQAKWKLRNENGDLSEVAKGTFQSLVVATVSPDGTWMAYYHSRALVAVSLVEAKSWTLELRAGETTGLALWAGAEYLSAEVGTQIILIRVPSGERTTYLDAGAEMASYPMWTTDGSRVAVRTKKGVAIYGGGKSVCALEGAWFPTSWSPNGRYLILRQGTVVPEMRVQLLDTTDNMCHPKLIPNVHNVERWHPSSTAVVLTTGLGPSDPGMLQLWEVLHDDPEFVQNIGEGFDPQWVMH